MYSQRYINVLQNMVPIRFRKPKFKAWYRTVAFSIQSMNDELSTYITSVESRLLFDGRKIYLERYLNNQFDPISKRIRITNAKFLTRTFKFNERENRPHWRFNRHDMTKNYVIGNKVVHYEHVAGSGGAAYLDIYECTSPSTGDNPRTTPGKWTKITSSDLPKPWRFNKADYADEYRFWILWPAALALDDQKKREVRSAMARIAYHGYEYKIGTSTEYIEDRKWL